MIPSTSLNRRQFLGTSSLLVASTALGDDPPQTRPAEPIIDIHQHTNYSGRTDPQLLRHQQAMGISLTMLLPAGSQVQQPSTHDGRSNGLAAKCGGNESVVAFAHEHPDHYLYFTNEVPDLPNAREEWVKYLKLGAKGIGEQKFNLDCDSAPMQQMAQTAAEFDVPVLIHFQEGMYNKNFPDFHRMLEKFPKVNFIGHAQSFWAYTDKNYSNAKDLYPRGKITPGGITDRYLSDYPNFFGDMSAGSGLNFLHRDEEHARGFLDRHQDKILYGSDCNDIVGRGPTCQGWMTIQTLRRLCASKGIERKILCGNARKLFRLGAE
jgi:predicted TIM-barrel fold metal-dependent hydrolase